MSMKGEGELSSCGCAASTSVGSLLVAADWACAHGHAGTLAHVLTQLCGCVHGDLSAELREVAEQCCQGSARAWERWGELQPRLRDQLDRERAMRSAGGAR